MHVEAATSAIAVTSGGLQALQIMYLRGVTPPVCLVVILVNRMCQPQGRYGAEMSGRRGKIGGGQGMRFE